MYFIERSLSDINVGCKFSTSYTNISCADTKCILSLYQGLAETMKYELSIQYLG